MTEFSNWSRALEAQRMRLLVSDLVAIGVTLGVDMAERAYLSLREEPRTAQGDRIDWTVIRARIEQAVAPAVLRPRRKPEGTALEGESLMAT